MTEPTTTATLFCRPKVSIQFSMTAVKLMGSNYLPSFFMCRTSLDKESGGRFVFDMNKRFKIVLLNLDPVRRAKNR